ncbi:GNAT family N-acetyltransferase [Nocardia aurantiaca]|uniref:GNAT family N-acetyltransferase n=1 Tax=Nocardia aurantiaca TaxID=2675850 RepID=UPI0018ABBF9D|nr:GNAT family N-acetyltransferase [Nocardia aurantiaca]
MPDAVEDLDQELRAECADPTTVYSAPSLFVLAYIEGELAGCAGLKRTDDDTAELTRLYVRPQFRGLGGELTKHVISKARETGASTIVLSVLHNRSRALNLYTNLGFQVASNPTTRGAFVQMSLSLGATASSGTSSRTIVDADSSMSFIGRPGG